MANKCLLFVIVITVVVSAANCQRQAQCCEEYCYDLDSERPQSAHFGTKTAYQIIKGSEIGRQYLVPNCNPVKIWMLSRHGTRLPDAKNMERLKALEFLRDEVVNNYEKRRSKPDVGFLCEGDLDILKQWRWDRNITADHAEFLTVQGWNDMKFLAIHYQRVFPNILENIYDQQKFQFRYTQTQRTEASFKAFVEGLFGENAHRYVKVQQTPANDTLLRPYKNCPAWNKQTAKADGSERKKFEQSQIFTQLVSDVSMRLGFKFPLKIEQIEDIFDMCRYDLAWKLDVPSPWCTAFTPNQINVLEYHEDLGYYYATSYGKAMNQNMQCEAVADMLKHLESRDLPKVIAYFSHLSAIQLFLTALGAAKDSDPPRVDNYYSMSRRKWRTSAISPFASNFAAIKYECPEETERQKVIFFLNEKPVDFSWCKVGLCNWSDVQEKFKRFSQGDCASTFCANSATLVQHTLLYAVIPCITLIAFRQWY